MAAQVVGTVYPDRRSSGYGLSRFRDYARLDFTKIAGHPEVALLKALMAQAGVAPLG